MVVTTDRAAMALEVKGAAAAVVRPLTAEIRSWPSAEGNIDTVVVVTTDRAAMALEVEGAAAAVVWPLTAEIRSWLSTEGSIDAVEVTNTQRRVPQGYWR